METLPAMLRYAFCLLLRKTVLINRRPLPAMLRFACISDRGDRVDLKKGGSVAALRAATEPPYSHKTLSCRTTGGMRHLLPGCGESEDEKKQLQSTGDLSLRCFATLRICGRGDSGLYKRGGMMAALRAAIIPPSYPKNLSCRTTAGSETSPAWLLESDDGKKQLQSAGDLSLRCIASLCISGRGTGELSKNKYDLPISMGQQFFR